MVAIPATVISASVSSHATARRRSGAAYVEGMNAFGGLKVQTGVSSLGVSRSTEQSFATIVSSLRPSVQKKKKKGGGALSSTCNAAGEIFRIAAIMNGLVLIGVAIGFVLLRVEAAIEESE